MKRTEKWITAEEIANALTHGIGTVLAIAAVILMFYHIARENGDLWHILSASVYGVSLILLYLMSTLYHSFFKLPKVCAVFKILDHSAIYLLIAGSYTPFLWIALRHSSGLAVSAGIWALAAAGIVWHCCNIRRFHILATLCYVGMGWMAVFLLPNLLNALPPSALLWLIAGGLSYTVGTVFYLWKGLPFQHTIWHLFVLGGSAAHFYCIYQFVLPMQSV